MRKIKDEVSLIGKTEVITMMDLRKNPGEVISSVELGKTFIITRSGRQVAVLSKLPGEQLTMTIDSKGRTIYDYSTRRVR